MRTFGRVAPCVRVAYAANLFVLLLGATVAGLCGCRGERTEDPAGPPEAVAEQSADGSAAGGPRPKPGPSSPAPDPRVIDTAVAKIQQAFEGNDAAAAAALTHPVAQARYKRVFEKHQGELRRVGALLATRKLVVATPDIAEYEVTENGRSFRVTFEKAGGQWLLSGL